MSDTTTAFPEGEEDQVSALAALLDAEDAPATPAKEAPDPASETDETAPAEADQPEIEEEVEPEETPAIEAPNSWSKEDREVFADLPPEAQAIVAKRETQRDTEIRRVQNEAAEARRTATAEAQLAAQERAYLSQTIAPVLQNLTATLQNDYSQARLTELANTDPAAYVKAIAQRDNLIVQHQMLNHEQNRQADYVRASEMQKLIEARPEWKDTTKFRTDAGKLSEYLVANGFTRDEVNSTMDHRALVVADKARRYDELLAARKAPASKVAQQPAPKVLRTPQRTTGEQVNTTQRDSLRNIARNGSADEQVAALAKILG